mgnify:CR=1 FL=1
MRLSNWHILPQQTSTIILILQVQMITWTMIVILISWEAIEFWSNKILFHSNYRMQEPRVDKKYMHPCCLQKQLFQKNDILGWWKENKIDIHMLPPCLKLAGCIWYIHANQRTLFCDIVNMTKQSIMTRKSIENQVLVHNNKEIL